MTGPVVEYGLAALSVGIGVKKPGPIALFACRPRPLLIAMAILALPQLKRAWRDDPDAPENRLYYTTPVETKTTYALCYVGLLAFLARMTSGVHDMPRVAHSAV